MRELVQFVLRSGDLGGERDFVGTDRALAGTRGHQRLQRSRPAGYQKEVSVCYDVAADEFTLRIRGRIDGMLLTHEEVLLEEIKTVQGSWDKVADPLHWAQAKFYGFIYAQAQKLKKVDIQLTYLHLETEEVTEFHHRFSFGELSAFFEETTAIYLDWMREQHRWRLERDESIRSLDFPFSGYRAGQRELAVAAYRTLADGGRLFLEAPTGIGKTISVIFPAMKALGEGKLERIFYLTARTVGRTIAEKAFADLRKGGLLARTVTLTAKEKICIRDGRPCDSTTCPLAIGYYDRCKAAMRDALGRGEITRSVLEAVGLKHQVCPFELSLDVSAWADAVICDYNYVFDPKVYLRRHFAEDGGDYAFLMDEAHNLVDRAREMFSANLDGGEILDITRAIRRAVPRCAKALVKLSAAMRKLGGSTAFTGESIEPTNPAVELNLFPSSPVAKIATISARDSRSEAFTRQKFPEELTSPLEEALKEAEKWLVRNQPSEFREGLLGLYFHLHSFRRTAELYDECYVTIIEPSPSVQMRLFCLDPSAALRQALARGQAAIFFSATLTPIHYYRALLGGAPEDRVLQLPSPFPPENLGVLIQDSIQTHFKARAGSLGDVVEAIGALVQGRRGNYLVYLPAYQYLTAVQEQFRMQYPLISILTQRPGMSEMERDAFLAAFTVEHGETLVGFAVLGGIFGEGIDLVGDRLIGVIIVGVGLPQLSVERDLIRDYFEGHARAGFDYAYTFPGMSRVLQAIGRVIRSETDRGVALLIDTRFRETRYRRLFPAWWRAVRVRSASEIRQAVGSFWEAD